MPSAACCIFLSTTLVLGLWNSLWLSFGASPLPILDYIVPGTFWPGGRTFHAFLIRAGPATLDCSSESTQSTDLSAPAWKFHPIMSRRVSIVDLTSARVHPSPRRFREVSSTPSVSPISSSSSSSPDPHSMPRGTKRKRRHNEGGPHSSAPSNHPQSPIESIDLTEVEGSSALAKALAKQREDAVKAQSTDEADKARSMLIAYQCPVCMDNLEDATSTSCGKFHHCHTFLTTYDPLTRYYSGHRPPLLSQMHRRIPPIDRRSTYRARKTD